jgi:hypothetical protein
LAHSSRSLGKVLLDSPLHWRGLLTVRDSPALGRDIVINLKTAKALGLMVPPASHAGRDVLYWAPSEYWILYDEPGEVSA